jgi:2,3-bisphosphoglycerate-independent phosphoglycerate mutase
VSEGGRSPESVVLCVLDGFGLSDDPMRNALLAARMPTWARLTAEWPTCQLDASGEAVGLPAGQMGNSEVGHLNLGAGFRVLQTCRGSAKRSRTAASSRTRC